jgi:hypothetical protein
VLQLRRKALHLIFEPLEAFENSRLSLTGRLEEAPLLAVCDELPPVQVEPLDVKGAGFGQRP